MEYVDRARQHGLDHVALAVAAAQAYHQLTGSTPEEKTAAPRDVILNRVAHAIANVAAIFVPDGQGMRQLLPLEFLHAQFRHGATVLKLKDGSELRGMTVRRVELREAVVVLKAVQARFDG